MLQYQPSARPPLVCMLPHVGRYKFNSHIRLLSEILKINGVRVDPRQSEHQLRLLGGSFTTCAVQGVRDDDHDDQLAVFIDVGQAKDGYNPKELIATEECSLSFKDMRLGPPLRVTLTTIC